MPNFIINPPPGDGAHYITPVLGYGTPVKHMSVLREGDAIFYVNLESEHDR